MTKNLDWLIKWGFYFLFFLVPLIFVSNTSELFEFNKMLLTYALTIIICTAWAIKMVLANKFIYKRTFLEIPLLLYLGSHILSTIFSIDPHVSLWGYYSRFHEGLLASTSYILLYFAAVSNLNKEDVYKIIKSSFAATIIVSVWGALEHFGYSPSCFLVTGKFNDACWIQDVKSRVFATLGQPNWMAAYLDILILTAIGFGLKLQTQNQKIQTNFKNLKIRIWSLGLILLFLSALYFTKSRSGYAGLAVGLGVLVMFLVNIPNRIKILISILVLVLGISFGIHWYQGLEPTPSGTITDSEAIRKPVWEGAIKVWQRYPVFGSGVETFGYSFYLDRPASKNLDSEWDFLYNKAHNEYLNLLATTGTVGFITYLLVIGAFCFEMLKIVQHDTKVIPSATRDLVLAIFAGWVTILVTNFFGFSVVIIGLYFFLIPALCEIIS